jgi:DNA-binding transcriptional LysR family regulator
MRIFARVVELESFSAAARRLGVSKALASKTVSQLEARLGARLLNRTTRRLHLTEVGRAYYRRALDILAEVEELEAAVRTEHIEPRGELRIAGPQTFGERHLVPLLDGFLHRYPEIRVNLHLTDRFLDLLEEGLDMAVRIGELADSSLIARRLCGCRTIVCASPGYLAHHGTPHHPDSLAEHQCVLDSNRRSPAQWQFRLDGQRRAVQVRGRVCVNSALAVRELVLRGHGIGLCPEFAVAADLGAGRLVALLERFEAYDVGIYAVYPYNRQLSGKVRALVEYLMEGLATTTR